MSKLADLNTVDKAFLMYSSGIKQADIAKELGVTPVTVNQWKKDYDWDAQLAEQGMLPEQVTDVLAELPIDPESKIASHLKDIVIEAIEVTQIRPTRWIDIINTVSLLAKLSTKPTKSSKKSIEDITELSDKELEKEIAALKNLVSIEEDNADIIVEGVKIH